MDVDAWAILWALLALVIGFVLLFILQGTLFLRNLSSGPKKTPTPGVVLLHELPPGLCCVNISPPCLKLETFLRMAKIPYETEYGLRPSKKGKVPWIEYNGKDVADSNFIVRFLMKEFKVDLDAHLSEAERAVCHAMTTMLEENTYWVHIFYGVADDTKCHSQRAAAPILSGIPFPLKTLFLWQGKAKSRKDLWAHGMGRHSKEDVYKIGRRDLGAVSTLLGNKKFVMGDKPCLLDAVMFGFVANMVWSFPESPMGLHVVHALHNLVQHCQRMKELYYPDWDDIISGTGKSKIQ